MSQRNANNGYDNYMFYDDNDNSRDYTINLSKPQNAVTIRDVCLSYGKNAVLTGINMTVPANRIYGLLGPSGCGKTGLNFHKRVAHML